MELRAMREIYGHYVPNDNCKFYRNYCIYKDRQSGMTFKEIGKKYSITPARVSCICRNVEHTITLPFYSHAYSTIEENRQLTLVELGLIEGEQ